MVIPVVPDVATTKSSAFAFPCAVAVPIPTLPADVMRSLSALFALSNATSAPAPLL